MSDAGVLGIATDGAWSVDAVKSIDPDRGLSPSVLCIELVRGVPNDERRTVSSVIPASRSPGVKNFFIISARTVGEASLIDFPLMIVTFWAP
jgi:hypothetical protein